MKDVADDYTAYLKTAEGVVNYDVDATAEIEVTDAGVFSDVPSAGVWYSEWVNAAAGKGYMTGYNHTTLFGPEDTITRGDVAVTLYKMAGGTPDADKEDTSEVEGYDTPFSDVDPGVYYAQAIQWAAKAGIVTGYDSTDLFKPTAPVSRQELATMLYRYAKVADIDAAGVEVSDDALDAYSDGASVAGFAEDAVAWAVEAEVMGQDVTEIRPADAITRAEVAAMTVRVQPEGRLDFDDMMDPNPAA
ncbi:S-layer homology domain-containing protein [Enorma phocaeensis]|uniref:S-layer homology domain-containing protein n=1 Tax=Enorma phocaeensis TaxID=1871019 RepID=UPI0019587821|nr:S-layer homology domain-containing protein [Enorma phocaeensis]MBM6953999.1 S-layer homology domain-containing protein [Enorma phocaeensis]